MKISEALKAMEESKKTESSKNELESLKKFSQLLNALLAKNLPLGDVSSIEEKLDSLSIGQNNSLKKGYWRKMVTNFTKFLAEKFNLIPKGHYTSLGVALGAGLGSSLGTVAGVVNDNIGLSISMGICFGLATGIIIGQYLDDKAFKEDRVL